jgi:hypothetical protein
MYIAGSNSSWTEFTSPYLHSDQYGPLQSSLLRNLCSDPTNPATILSISWSALFETSHTALDLVKREGVE